ncbi:ATP-binding cassette domain-containing protein, partial [Sphingomonas koreensis]
MNVMNASSPAPTAVPRTAPSLEAVRLCKSFLSGMVSVQVLQGLSVSLYAGELSLISGPSGCGKSTLLSLMSGLQAPDSGYAMALGEDLGKLGTRALEKFRLRHTGFV